MKRLISTPSAVVSTRSDEKSPVLDGLYHQILVEVFPTSDREVRAQELAILHALFCTAEPTSEAVIAALLCPSQDDDLYLYRGTVAAILSRLHAVMYTDNGRILSYHKSFSDFLFDRQRSGQFHCDQAARHRLFAESTFRVMKRGLRFNLANIPSSFVLDCDNSILSSEIERSIPAVLRYCCQYWSYHVCLSSFTASDSLHHDLLDFLQLRALFWIEAMNLLDLRGLCEAILRRTSDLVKKVSCVVPFQFTYFSCECKGRPVFGRQFG